MRRLLQNRTPAQLGWIIIASNLLVASFFATVFVDSYRHHRLPHWVRLVSLAIFILGLAIGQFARRLSRTE